MLAYGTIKEAIDDWDPIELLTTHAPADEYDNESKIIFDKLNALPSVCVEDLAKVILDVFTKSFGNDMFRSEIDQCKWIASKILGE